MMFDFDELIATDKRFIFDDSCEFSYAEALRYRSLFKGDDKELVMIEMDKDVWSVVIYLCALSKNKAVMLIDPESRNHGALIDLYKPRYIFSRKTYGYPCATVSGENKLFETSFRTVVHPELSLIMLTSGSTNDPKCVRIFERQARSSIASISEYLRKEIAITNISLLPFFYSYGLSVLNNCIRNQESLYISSGSIMESSLLDSIEKHGVNSLSCVPFMVKVLARLKPDFFEKIEIITQAGGRLEDKFIERMLLLSKKCGFEYLTMYGATEASPRICYVPYNSEAFEKVGSVGKPISCGSITLADDGEIIFSGLNVCSGYAYSSEDLLKDDEFKSELKTGDLGYCDEDGFLFITGRKKRNIKINGITINLDFVEKSLAHEYDGIIVTGLDNTIIVVDESEERKNQVADSVRRIIAIPNFKIRQINEPQRLTSSGKPDYRYFQEIANV